MDDLMPNDGSAFYPEVPEAVKEEVSKERGLVMGSLPIYADVMSWFDAEIMLADSIDNILMSGDISIESQMSAQKLLKKKLVEKKEEFKALFESYKKG